MPEAWIQPYATQNEEEIKALYSKYPEYRQRFDFKIFSGMLKSADRIKLRKEITGNATSKEGYTTSRIVFPLFYTATEVYKQNLTLDKFAQILKVKEGFPNNEAFLLNAPVPRCGEPFSRLDCGNGQTKILQLDVDSGFDCSDIDFSTFTGEQSLLEVYGRFLEKANFWSKDIGVLLQMSNKFAIDTKTPRIRIFAELTKSEPIEGIRLRCWQSGNSLIDASVYSRSQPWFLHKPILKNLPDIYWNQSRLLYIPGRQIALEEIPQAKVDNSGTKRGKTDRNPAHRPRELDGVDASESQENVENAVVELKQEETEQAETLREAIYKATEAKEIVDVLRKGIRKVDSFTVALDEKRNKVLYNAVCRALDIGEYDLFYALMERNTELLREQGLRDLENKRLSYERYLERTIGLVDITQRFTRTEDLGADISPLQGDIGLSVELDTKDLTSQLERILPLIQEGSVISIRSAPGTAKTTIINEICNFVAKSFNWDTSAYASYLRSIGQSSGSKTGHSFYLPENSKGSVDELTPEQKRQRMGSFERVAVTDKSLRLDPKPRDVLILDEFEQTLRSLNAVDNVLDINEVLHKASQAKLVLILDADMTANRTGLFLQKLKEYEARKKFWLVNNVGHWNVGRTWTILKSDVACIAQACECIAQGKKVFIHTDIADKKEKGMEISRWVATIEEFMRVNGIPGYVRGYDAQSLPNDVRYNPETTLINELKDGLVCQIQNKTTGRGWDFLGTEENHFGVSIGIYKNGYSTSYDVYQGNRARRAKEVYVSMPLWKSSYITTEEAKEVFKNVVRDELSLTDLERELIQESASLDAYMVKASLYCFKKLLRDLGECFELEMGYEPKQYSWVKEKLTILKNKNDEQYFQEVLSDPEVKQDFLDKFVGLREVDLDFKLFKELNKEVTNFNASIVSEMVYLTHLVSPDMLSRVTKTNNKVFPFPALFIEVIQRINESLVISDRNGADIKSAFDFVAKGRGQVYAVFSEVTQKELQGLLENKALGLDGVFDYGDARTPKLSKLLKSFFKGIQLKSRDIENDGVGVEHIYSKYKRIYKSRFLKTWSLEQKKYFILGEIKRKIGNRQPISHVEWVYFAKHTENLVLMISHNTYMLRKAIHFCNYKKHENYIEPIVVDAELDGLSPRELTCAQ